MIVLGEGHQCSHKAQDPYDKLDADILHQRKNCIALEKTRSALLCICGSVTAPLRPQLRLEVRVVLTILHGAISASLPGDREKSRVRVAPTLTRSHGVVIVSHVKSTSLPKALDLSAGLSSCLSCSSSKLTTVGVD